MYCVAAGRKDASALPRQMNRNTFGQHERIKHRKEITSFFETKSISQYNDVYRVLARENGREYARLGVVISKKHAKAVRRNKEKRWVRELFRTRKDEIQKGIDYVVVVRACKTISFVDRTKKLLSLLKRVATNVETRKRNKGISNNSG